MAAQGADDAAAGQLAEPKGDVASDAHAPIGQVDLHALAVAEDLRHAKDVDALARTSHDPAIRRRAARALARIGDGAAEAGLLAALTDEDPETVAWAAYGLGFGCKGHEDTHVAALAARAADLPPTGPPRAATLRGEAEVEPWTSTARALGRCGGPLAEQLLVNLAKTEGGGWQGPALLGLGDLATRRKQLSAEAMTLLLDLEAKAPLAYYALSRAEAGDTFGPRVAAAARAALGRASPERILAIKALGRSAGALANAKGGKNIETAPGAAFGQLAASDLSHLVATDDGVIGERVEAAHALALLGPAGVAAAADLLVKLAPASVDVALGSRFAVLSALVATLGPEPPKSAEPALRALAGLGDAEHRDAPQTRRASALRCAAALALARGAYDSDVLDKCDAGGDKSSEAAETARLKSLLRRPIAGDRKAAFRALVKSEHLKVAEAALEAIGDHPELGDAAAPLLARALESKHAGLVATAAEVLHDHPDRALVLAESERRAALDPHAPPPGPNPKEEILGELARALTAARAAKWPEDRFETRIAVVDAMVAVHHPDAKAAATAACADPNGVVREHAQKALRALGEPITACAGRPPDAALAPELAEAGELRQKAARVVLTTDAGLELVVILEPELSPVTATRLASLAASGFFKGIVVHRVVPGFVVQLGDPEGDGYGGSGTSLRCETSPVPFAALDVGMALAGRDTGSSQLFVTLSRTPHLDGEYTRVGSARGDWTAVAEGDIVSAVRLEDL